MDLIDRAALLKDAVWLRGGNITESYANGYMDGLDAVEKAIRALPAVEAVPLDKLCEWLGKCANPCKIGIRCHYPDDCMPTVECWRYVLTKWMEEQEITT